MTRSFLTNVNLIFFTQVVNRFLAFITIIIIARGLGPEGRGDYALFVLSVTFAASLSTMGVGLGTIYYIGKGKHDIPVLLGNSHFLTLVMGALVAAIIAGIGLGFEPRAFVEGRSFWLYAFAFPVVLEFLLVTAILVGSERFLPLNLSLVSQALVLMIGATVLWIGGWMSIFSVLSVWVFSYAAGAMLALASVGLRQLSLRRAMRPDLPVMREQVRFGLPGQAGNTLTRLNYRLDQYVVRAFRSRADVGFYAVATGLAEAVWWISNAVSTALMPRLTRMGLERAGEVTPIACRNTLLASLVAGIGLAAAAPLAVKLFFGNEFGPAVQPIYWLLPGIVMLSGTKVLASYFFSQARLAIVSMIALISLAATLAFDLLLIPEFGISGAAAASSIAYSVSFVVALYFYRRISGNNVWDCVLPKLSDLELYVDLGKRLRRLKVPASATGAEEVGIGGSGRPEM
jgi:O-antigen/teichoic acid export membrane protein